MAEFVDGQKYALGTPEGEALASESVDTQARVLQESKLWEIAHQVDKVADMTNYIVSGAITPEAESVMREKLIIELEKNNSFGLMPEHQNILNLSTQKLQEAVIYLRWNYRMSNGTQTEHDMTLISKFY